MRWAVRLMVGMGMALGALAWAPSAGEATDATVTATGRFVFRKFIGTQAYEVGIKRARVEMCDDDGILGCQLMATGQTDDDGYFSLTGRAGDFFTDLPDPLVKVIAISDAATVENPALFGGTYCFRSEPRYDRPHGSTVDFGTISPLNGGVGCSGGSVQYENDAWDIHNLAVESRDFMQTFTTVTPGRDVPSVKVRWPADQTKYDPPDFFSPNGTISMINITPSERIFMKHYGHHVLQHFADNPVANFNNGICDTHVDTRGIENGRCAWQSESGYIPWTEGFPLYLAEVMTRFYGYQGFSTFHIGQGPHPHPDENFVQVPEVTATILWNLTGWVTALGETVALDPDGNNHDSNNSRDNLSVGFETIWDTIINFDPASGDPTHNHPRSIGEFWWAFVYTYPDLANRLSAVYHESHVNMLAANLTASFSSVTPAVVSPGSSVTIVDVVGNTGYVSVGETSTTGFFLSTDMTYGPGDIYLGQRAVPNLVAGRGSNGSTTVVIPAGVAPGTYYVLACADVTGLIFESDETDNCMASEALRVVAAAVAPGAPSALAQFRVDGTTAVPVGGFVSQAGLVLRFTMTDGSPSDTLTPEIEIKPIATAFDGSGLRAGAAVASTGSPVSGSVTVTGLANGVAYHWRGRVKDAGGQVSNWVSFGGNAETAADVTVDTALPTGSVKIDNGAAWTDSTAVSLKLTCSDAKSGCDRMQLSNDNHAFTPSEPFAATRAWTLGSGDGKKTVYVRYIDRAGNVSKSYLDSITLDTARPVIGPVIPSPVTIRPALGETTTISIPLSDNLSGSCSVKVRILGAGGLVAKTVTKTATCSAAGATTTVAWDGRNASRAIVPPGTYFIEVTATDHAGNAAVAEGTVAVQ